MSEGPREEAPRKRREDKFGTGLPFEPQVARTESPGQGRRGGRRRRSRRMRMPPWVGVLGTAALALAIGAFFGGTHAYVVPTDSMIPTLLRGDEFRAETWNAELGHPKRGEIWVFHNPRQTDDTGPILVKRVIGLPGETVSVRKKQLLVNGQPLPEKYCREPIGYSMKPVRLGADQYWMLGDNRNHSGDSHEWGPLSRRLLIGHAFVRYWPLERFAWL